MGGGVGRAIIKRSGLVAYLGLGKEKCSTHPDLSGCQNYGPFLGTLNIRGRIMIETQKGAIILTTNHLLLGTWTSVGSRRAAQHQLIKPIMA